MLTIQQNGQTQIQFTRMGIALSLKKCLSFRDLKPLKVNCKAINNGEVKIRFRNKMGSSLQSKLLMLKIINNN